MSVRSILLVINTWCTLLWQRHSQLTWYHFQHHDRVGPLSKSDRFSIDSPHVYALAVELTLVHRSIFLFFILFFIFGGSTKPTSILEARDIIFHSHVKSRDSDAGTSRRMMRGLTISPSPSVAPMHLLHLYLCFTSPTDFLLSPSGCCSVNLKNTDGGTHHLRRWFKNIWQMISEKRGAHEGPFGGRF